MIGQHADMIPPSIAKKPPAAEKGAAEPSSSGSDGSSPTAVAQLSGHASDAGSRDGSSNGSPAAEQGATQAFAGGSSSMESARVPAAGSKGAEGEANSLSNDRSVTGGSSKEGADDYEQFYDVEDDQDQYTTDSEMDDSQGPSEEERLEAARIAAEEINRRDSDDDDLDYTERQNSESSAESGLRHGGGGGLGTCVPLSPLTPNLARAKTVNNAYCAIGNPAAQSVAEAEALAAARWRRTVSEAAMKLRAPRQAAPDVQEMEMDVRRAQRRQWRQRRAAAAAAEAEAAAAAETEAAAAAGEVREGLSEEHRRFLLSEGREEEKAFLRSCLDFADGDRARATDVARRFCDFRMRYGWPMRIRQERVEKTLCSGVHMVLPDRDAHGRVVVTFTPRAIDPSLGAPVAYQELLGYILDEVSREPGVSTDGVALVMDARCVSMLLLRHFGVEDYRRGVGAFSGSYPIKCRSIVVLGPTTAVSVGLKVALPFLSSKMRNRLRIIDGASAENGTWAEGFLQRSQVPKEVGGPWDGLQDWWRKWTTQHRQ